MAASTTPAGSHRSALDAAWDAYGDPRHVIGVTNVSANVSTNRVYRMHLDDGSSVSVKTTIANSPPMNR